MIAIAIVFLAVVILGCVGMLLAPRFGWQLSSIRGGSMEPTLGDGSMAVVQPVETDAIAAGDIVEYASPSAPSETVIHRVVEVVEEGGLLQFRTQGDANNSPDPYLVAPQSIRGRVMLCIPYLGYVMEYVGTPLGRGLLFGIPAVLIILFEARRIVTTVVYLRRKARLKRMRQAGKRPLRRSPQLHVRQASK